jgi:hypothetical protein
MQATSPRATATLQSARQLLADVLRINPTFSMPYPPTGAQTCGGICTWW